MGKPLILGGKLTLPLDSQTQYFLFNVQLLWSYDYSKSVIFTKYRILQWKILNFRSLWSGGWKLLDQSTKRQTLRQIWSNKSFGVCGSSVGLTLYDGEKKSMRESPLESRCRLYHYGRYRAVVIIMSFLLGTESRWYTRKPQCRCSCKKNNAFTYNTHFCTLHWPKTSYLYTHLLRMAKRMGFPLTTRPKMPLVGVAITYHFNVESS